LAIGFEVRTEYQKKLDWITYAMTEPQASSDHGPFRHQARRDGDEWQISAEKWFASNCGFADGPTEVHKSTIAKSVSKKHKQHKAREGLWPSAHIPSREPSARAHIEARIDNETAKL